MKHRFTIGLLTMAFAGSSIAAISAANYTSQDPTPAVAGKTATEAAKNQPSERPLRILIVNDDGCGSYGTTSLKEKLDAKGYETWISAPANNQSGIGSAITFKLGKEFEIKKLGERHYCFPGTPADALDFGALGLLHGQEIDLVISGVNDGPNTGMAQVNSGTVGAAVRAMRLGYPAIAASIGIRLDELGTGLQSTIKYWPDSVDHVVVMVDTLAKDWKPGTALLPKGTGLSINYPPLAKNEIKGIKYTTNLFNPGPQFYYEMLPNGNAKQVLIESSMQDNNDNSDTSWLAKGYITYNILDADWNAPQYTEEFQRRLTAAK